MTLWQMFYDWCKRTFTKKEKSLEFYNPLKGRVQESTLLVNSLELRDLTFRLLLVKEFECHKIKFADYYCKSVLQNFASVLQTGEPEERVIRVYPSEVSGKQHQILVLKRWDVVDYDENFKILLKDEQFNLHWDDAIEAFFWRINGVKSPYMAMCREMTKEGISPALETWYWDYWRETKDEAGTPYKEFLFVEWDKSDTGRFTILRGEEYSPTLVTMM